MDFEFSYFYSRTNLSVRKPFWARNFLPWVLFPNSGAEGCSEQFFWR